MSLYPSLEDMEADHMIKVSERGTPLILLKCILHARKRIYVFKT